MALKYIQFGNPQQNVCVERVNRTVRDDWFGIARMNRLPRCKMGLLVANDCNVSEGERQDI